MLRIGRAMTFARGSRSGAGCCAAQDLASRCRSGLNGLAPLRSASQSRRRRLSGADSDCGAGQSVFDGGCQVLLQPAGAISSSSSSRSAPAQTLAVRFRFARAIAADDAHHRNQVGFACQDGADPASTAARLLFRSFQSLKTAWIRRPLGRSYHLHGATHVCRGCRQPNRLVAVNTGITTPPSRTGIVVMGLGFSSANSGAHGALRLLPRSAIDDVSAVLCLMTTPRSTMSARSCDTRTWCLPIRAATVFAVTPSRSAVPSAATISASSGLPAFLCSFDPLYR